MDRSETPNEIDETADLFSGDEEDGKMADNDDDGNGNIESGSDGELGSKGEGEEEEEEEEEKENKSDGSMRSPSSLDDSCLKRPNPFKVISELLHQHLKWTPGFIIHVHCKKIVFEGPELKF